MTVGHNKYPYLDKNLATLAEIIGLHNLIRLARWQQEQRHHHQLYIPNAVSFEHPIAKIIGFNNFRRLCRFMGGKYISLPNFNRLGVARYTVMALLAAYPHKSFTEIALLARVDKSFVSKVIRQENIFLTLSKQHISNAELMVFNS